MNGQISDHTVTVEELRCAEDAGKPKNVRDMDDFYYHFLIMNMLQILPRGCKLMKTTVLVVKINPDRRILKRVAMK